jgi:hypothetical protein
MSILRAIFRLFSELTEATTATVDDWLAIQKNGETQLKKIKPTNLPYAATSHAHGNLTSGGKLGSIANLPLITGTSGAITTGSFGTSANTFCEGDDSRLSNSRTPTSHSHAIGDLPTPTTGTPAELGTASRGSATTLSRSDHVHPMPSAADVSALPASGGTLTGTLSLSVSTGERSLNIGTSRTGDGNSILRFYATNGGAVDASVFRVGGEDGELRLKNERGTGGARFMVSNLYIRNQADNGWVPISASAFTVNSDPRNKRDITEPGPLPTARALGDAAIEFSWEHAPGRHLGFDAERIRQIAPLASTDLLADAETNRTELGIDLAALLAIQAKMLADLSDRLDAVERAGQRSPRA